MNTRRFFEAMNEVSDKYYEEAAMLILIPMQR